MTDDESRIDGCNRGSNTHRQVTVRDGRNGVIRDEVAHQRDFLDTIMSWTLVDTPGSMKQVGFRQKIGLSRRNIVDGNEGRPLAYTLCPTRAIRASLLHSVKVSDR